MRKKIHRVLLLTLSIVSLMILAILSACSFTSVPTPAATPTPNTSPSTPTSPPTQPAASPTQTTTTGQSINMNLTAQNMAFDQSVITVPAGASVTMLFINKDSAPHNFALYTDSSASKVIFKGDVISSSTITYKFDAPSTPGTYFFRCDVHPTTMTGSFIVK